MAHLWVEASWRRAERKLDFEVTLDAGKLVRDVQYKRDKNFMFKWPSLHSSTGMLTRERLSINVWFHWYFYYFVTITWLDAFHDRKTCMKWNATECSPWKSKNITCIYYILESNVSVWFYTVRSYFSFSALLSQISCTYSCFVLGTSVCVGFMFFRRMCKS